MRVAGSRMSRIGPGLVLLIAARLVMADAVSTFDTGMDGWVGEDGTFTYQSTGGNPGGYIRFEDTAGTGYVRAPSKFLGDWSVYAGGVLSWDHSVINPGGAPTYYPAYAEITGPGGQAYYTSQDLCTTSWKTFTVPIDPSAWVIWSGSWNSLMADVTSLRIMVEGAWNGASPLDTDGIDNIMLIGEPVFVVSSRTVVVPEGGTATFTVALVDDPNGTVTVTVARASGDTDITVQSGGTLTFNSSNYQQPQTVTLAAQPDADNANGSAQIRLSMPGKSPTLVTAVENDSDAIHVKADATGAGTGRSWEDAYTNPQDALAEAAQSGGNIWVAAGVYRPDVGQNQTPGSRLASFELIKNVNIYGGFGGNEVRLEDRNPALHETILSGDLAGNDVGGLDDPSRGENAYHVVTGSGTDASACLDGFTITGGNASAAATEHGYAGGLWNVAGSPTVRHCLFTRNSAARAGGAVSNDQSSPTLVGCRFMNNQAGHPSVVSRHGGAMYNYYSAPLVVNCLFAGNVAKSGSNSAGGAVSSLYDGQNGPAVFVNCVFSGNTSGYRGGAFYNQGGNPQLYNCVFSRNVAGYSGGLYSRETACAVRAFNSVFWGNRDDTGTTRAAQFNGEAQVSDPVLGYIAVGYAARCVIQSLDGLLTGGDNMDVDPQFVDADGADNTAGTADDDLRPAAGSPVVDAGFNALVPADAGDADEDGNTAETTPRDAAGTARLQNDPCLLDTGTGTPPIVDIGAYEYTPDCNANGQGDDLDIAAQPALDKNGNGAIDACEVDPACGGLADCNHNFVPDDWDLTSGTSQDCNGNDKPDECDIASGSSQDCDANGVPDECELATHDCNSNSKLDACDVLSGLSEDCNNNKVPDECEPDVDGDRIPAACDNCPLHNNPLQEDSDSDGTGDACDSCTDVDGDGFGATGWWPETCMKDNCPTVPNTLQQDADTDGLGDACDPCTDFDDDGYGDPGYPVNTCPIDNCPGDANPSQEDLDQDGIGDVCDPCTDQDGDGWSDPGFAWDECPHPGAWDNCPTVPNPGQEDSNGNGTGDACEGGPLIAAAVSQQAHGSASTFDVQVVPPGAVEPRVPQATWAIVATFDRPIRGHDGLDAGDVALSAGSVVGGSLAIDGASLSLSVSVPDATALTVGFPGIESDLVPESLPAAQTVCFRVLVGDVTADGRVTSADLLAVRGHLGQTTSEANFRSDVNCDSRIDSQDVLQVRSRMGRTCPACP